MAKVINLPVIDRVQVRGYQTFTSPNNGGLLDHEFVDGVNLVVGVNGLGKTTLLRLIHRVLAGPFDLRTTEELGQAQREIKPVTRAGRLFGDRVPDGAKNAVATLRFRIGNKHALISRRLDNLRIADFRVNDKAVLNERLDAEDQYQNWFTEASGCGSFFDVLLTLQYLVFFFEDRRSIVWDADAQDELTRLFLYPTEDAKLYRSSFNLSQQADSLARNYQNILTRERRALDRAAKEAADGTNSHAQDVRLYKSLSDRLASAKVAQQELESGHRAAVQLQLGYESELLNLQDRISASRGSVLSSLFPALEDYGAIVLSRMQSEKLCIVCGSEEELAIEAALDAWTKAHNCPCCKTPIQQHGSALSKELSGEAANDLDKLHLKRLDLRSKLEDVRNQVRDFQQKLSERGEEVAKILLEYEPISFRVEAVKRRDSKQSSERIRSLEEGMDAARADRERHLGILRKISEKHEKSIKRTIDRIAQEFNEIVEVLLAEKCELSASIAEMRVGEGQSDLRVLAPRFVPMMTSATSPDVTVPRRSPDSVSESQRDLIDFAFRLAFLRVSAAKQAVSIFVDTPESSLDSVFIPRYAKLLLSEGKSAQGARRFVVTANLTGSSMITKLLNTTGKKRLTGPQRKHLLYLLDQTAASASVRRHLKEYQRDFDRAVRAQ